MHAINARLQPAAALVVEPMVSRRASRTGRPRNVRKLDRRVFAADFAMKRFLLLDRDPLYTSQ
jgi:hypothetical protein